MMDEIRIDDLEIFARHGVYEQEKIDGQIFYVNAILCANLQKAGRSDNLSDSTHYGEVCETIKVVMIENRRNLIEAIAEKITSVIFEKYPLIQKIELEVRKPYAPISIPFRSVSVKLKREWHNVVIAMGANVGNAKQTIEAAFTSINERQEFKDCIMSSVIQTKPYGGIEQEDFFNSVMQCKTYFEPENLLEQLKLIEEEAGRVVTTHWGPRVLDLDIIFYDKLIMETEKLTIPHIDMENRQFVLEPLCQIAPYVRHPITQKTVFQMKEDMEKSISSGINSIKGS